MAPNPSRWTVNWPPIANVPGPVMGRHATTSTVLEVKPSGLDATGDAVRTREAFHDFLATIRSA
jgi:hypothetical protein